MIDDVVLHRLLALLLHSLESEGLRLGTDRHLRLQRLLTPGAGNRTLMQWRSRLTPLLATSPREQERVYAIFDHCAVEIEQSIEAPPDKMNMPEAATLPEDEFKKKEDEEQEPDLSNLNSKAETLPARFPLVAELERSTKPPLSWSFRVGEEVSVDLDGDLSAALARLRQREQGEGSRLDIPTTIRSTIKMGGLPVFRYRTPTRPTEYLLLVDHHSLHDHRARAFDNLYRILRAKEVLVERFFYDGDLRLCRNETWPAGISLEELRYRYHSARLVAVGSGYRLLDPATGKLANWARILRGWPRRVLLTPVSRYVWGQWETQLNELFTLLPAAVPSLQFLADAAGSESFDADYAALPQAVRAAAEVEPLDLRAPFVPRLREHFDRDMLAWIAACAVYPALHYGLTLRLGILASPPEHSLVTTSRLIALSRISWFVQGRIPPEARRELVEYLERRHPDLRRKVLTELRNLFEQLAPPPPGSAARAEYEINLAVLRASDDKTPPPEELREELRELVRRLDRPAELWDFVLPASWEKFLGSIDPVVSDETVTTDDESEDDNLSKKIKMNDLDLPEVVPQNSIDENILQTFQAYYNALKEKKVVGEAEHRLFATVNNVLPKAYHDAEILSGNRSHSLFSSSLIYMGRTFEDLVGDLESICVFSQSSDRTITFKHFTSEPSGSSNKKFSIWVKEIINKAGQEARQLDHNYVGTEHLLLAMIAHRDNLAVQVLDELLVDTNDLKKRLERSIPKLSPYPPAENLFVGDLKVTTQFQNVLKRTFLEAKIVKSEVIYPEHLMMALLKYSDAFATKLLAEYDVDYDTFRKEYEYVRYKSGEAEDQTIVSEEEMAPAKAATPTPSVPVPVMVFVRGGSFLMGSDDDKDAYDDEKPQHRVLVSDYYIGQHQVTNHQYCAFLNEKGNQTEGGAEWINLQGSYEKEKCRILLSGNTYSVEPGYAVHPVIYVSWYGARAYADWLTGKTGKKYRLPTEAEWEYAARGGVQSNGFKYAGGNKPGDVAWFSENSGGQTHPVGQKIPNELGLYDMSGNVWEWCEDVWHSSYKDAPADGSAWVTGGDNSQRVVRGGSWDGLTRGVRVAVRSLNAPSRRNSSSGFRLAQGL